MLLAVRISLWCVSGPCNCFAELVGKKWCIYYWAHWARAQGPPKCIHLGDLKQTLKNLGNNSECFCSFTGPPILCVPRTPASINAPLPVVVKTLSRERKPPKKLFAFAPLLYLCNCGLKWCERRFHGLQEYVGGFTAFCKII